MLAWCKSFTSKFDGAERGQAKEKRVETQTHTRLQDTDSVERELSAHTSIIDQRSCSSSFSSEIREKNHVQTRKRSIFSCNISRVGGVWQETTGDRVIQFIGQCVTQLRL